MGKKITLSVCLAGVFFLTGTVCFAGERAVIAETEGKLSEISTLTELAETGDAKAQYALGIRYQNGDGVEQDSAKAVSLFRDAAKGDNAKAQFLLGLFYTEGIEGLPQDFHQAAELYKKAATQHFAPAKEALQKLYKVHPELRS
ncbi:sel1 repeat family protein [Acetobacteraceae bacterium]|nr:sel1 repeat family protein [Acetobacteraceae bacterium]